LKAIAVKGEALAGFGDGLGFVDDEAGDGDGFFVGQIPIHRAIEIADRHGAVDIDAAIGLRAHADDGDVVLVFDVADDLFENVFERDEAHQRAVLVHDQREVFAAAQEFGELIFGARS
jgi:hypothetical protein